MGSPRRVGAETSQTRDALLDAVEQLMREQGYAGVTYRAVAAKAGVTAGLVQYYFPKQDDVFVAAVRRRSEQNLSRLRQALDADPDRTLRVLWEYSREESAAALTTEFMALGNHRPSVRTVIAEVTEQVRQVQLEALARVWKRRDEAQLDLTPESLLFLLTGVPKLLRLEAGIGVSTTHAQAVAAFDAYLDRVEPTSPRRGRTARSRKRG
ncbi:MAG TPA: TetR/AcrR family transcriptional regulator [Mycobacteriales bacterium]|nr:TetR/AcrR family transcriptional regulator [Mycobacteriales bacterium]